MASAILPRARLPPGRFLFAGDKKGESYAKPIKYKRPFTQPDVCPSGSPQDVFMITCMESYSCCPLAVEHNLQPFIEIVRKHVLGTCIVVDADDGQTKELTPATARPPHIQPVIPIRLPYPDRHLIPLLLSSPRISPMRYEENCWRRSSVFPASGSSASAPSSHGEWTATSKAIWPSSW